MQKNGCSPKATAVFVYLQPKNKQYKLPKKCWTYAHKPLSKASLQARTLTNRAGNKSLVVRSCVYQRSEKNMPQFVYAEVAEIYLGKIQPKSAFEAFDSPGQLVSAQGSN